MHAVSFILALFAASAAAQRGEGGECHDDRDCIRCQIINGVQVPLICFTDDTSTTGRRCGKVNPPCQPFKQLRARMGLPAEPFAVEEDDF